MTRICYINHRYQPISAEATPMNDRGLQFGDGVYEVMEYWHGTVLHEEEHLHRLRRSMREVQIDLPMADSALKIIFRQLMRRNRLPSGLIYLQVNRGIAPRDHVIPDIITPTVMISLMRPKSPSIEAVQKGMKLITAPDIRWARCDVKTVALLGNVLLKSRAAEAGAKEALIYDEASGDIRECSASNFYLVTPEGVVVTHPADHRILPGIVRDRLLALAAGYGIRVEERAPNLRELATAKEAFVTSTSLRVMPVSHIDGKPVGNAAAGLTTLKLRELFDAEVHHLLQKAAA